MAAALLVLLALAQGLPIQDGPIGTAPRLPTARPPAAVTAPITPGLTRPNAQPPADDYGYVAWCYGALETYLGLYDRVMPEVTRIERAFPSPRGADNDLKVYPAMRDQARKDLATYRNAIIATEKASPKPISEYGARAMRSGQALWTGSDRVKPAELAREWMGWAPPGKCEQTAKSLAVKSNVLGQALIFNAAPVPDAPSALPPPPPPAPAPVPAVIAAEPPPPPKPAAVVPAAAKPPVVQAVTPKPAAPPPVAKPVAAPTAPKPVAPKPVVAQVEPKPALAPVAPAAALAGAPKTPPAAPKTVVAQAEPKPAAKPATPAAVAPTGPAPVLPKGAYVMDPDSDKGCPGRLDASIRAGRIVMICMP